MSKPFMTYDQQIQKLKDKHLMIEDEEKAKSVLRNMGYFALITGYKDLFKNPTTHNYKDGTAFEDILALYQFDENLRALTLRHLLHIEQHIRSVLSYAFCKMFGDNQTAYITYNNYDYSSISNKKQIEGLIKKYLEPLLKNKTSYPYIEHYKKAHSNVPLWVLMNALTFGNISKMYGVSKPQLQTVVSKEFEFINEQQLAQILQVLTVYRNICAHSERLFSYNNPLQDIPDLPLHKNLAIPQKGTQCLYGKRDYFAVILSFRYLLSNQEFREFQINLSQLLDEVVQNNRQLSKNELLKLMGMPENWESIINLSKS